MSSYKKNSNIELISKKKIQPIQHLKLKKSNVIYFYNYIIIKKCNKNIKKNLNINNFNNFK